MEEVRWCSWRKENREGEGSVAKVGEGDGLFLVGRLVEVSPVRYGEKHSTHAGQPVAGFFKASVQVGSNAFPTQATFNLMDPETDTVTPIAKALADQALKGARIGLKVRASGSKGGSFANLQALNVVEVPDEVPDSDEDGQIDTEAVRRALGGE